MTRNVHLKFRIGSPELELVSEIARQCGTTIEQLAKKSLIYACTELQRASRDLDQELLRGGEGDTTSGLGGGTDGD